MPVFSYAFVQFQDKLYSFLKRTYEGKAFFDEVLFGEQNYISIQRTDIWEIWKKESSFCPSIDTVDFIFLIPTDSKLSVLQRPSAKSAWKKEEVMQFLQQKLKHVEISGSLDGGLSIQNRPYKIIRYLSDTLP